MSLIPVILPPGRLKLATRSYRTGSAPVLKTIGMVVVAAFAARAASREIAAMTVTRRRTRSAANAAASSALRAARYSIVTLRPSIKPVLLNPSRNAAPNFSTCSRNFSTCSSTCSRAEKRNPITGTPRCCARAASGQAHGNGRTPRIALISAAGKTGTAIAMQRLHRALAAGYGPWLKRHPPPGTAAYRGAPAARCQFSAEQGIHAERIDMSGEQAARQPEKRQIRRDFANSLLNSLLAGNCGRPKRGDFQNEIFTASVEHRATANAKPTKQGERHVDVHHETSRPAARNNSRRFSPGKRTNGQRSPRPRTSRLIEAGGFKA
jgi:hypothetical protein